MEHHFESNLNNDHEVSGTDLTESDKRAEPTKVRRSLAAASNMNQKLDSTQTLNNEQSEEKEILYSAYEQSCTSFMMSRMDTPIRAREIDQILSGGGRFSPATSLARRLAYINKLKADPTFSRYFKQTGQTAATRYMWVSDPTD